ncbi:MAG: NAD(P)/FAD-dependent oxidoreductase [Cyclobacteriaceae bacterium]
MSKSIIIVGGGAAGYFSAINIAEKHPDYQVTILEKASQGLAKVRISGGGRCNVTNERKQPAELVNFYPRGQKKLYSVFKKFTTSDMVDWLKSRGVETQAEIDQRVFPASNTSQTIIDCFVNQAARLRIVVKFNTSVKSLVQNGDHWKLETNRGEEVADVVIYATGSSPSSMAVLTKLGLQSTALAPSLFTFNISDARIKDLEGLSFRQVKVKVAKTKLEDEGPMLITHWGLSGPAVLKLSAWGALGLKEMGYRFQIMLNFTPDLKQEQVRAQISALKSNYSKRKTVNYPLFDLPRRFWERICAISEIDEDLLNLDLSKKQINKLTEELTQGLYHVNGKSTFKEEFVTCGGVDLSEINLDTFECRRFPSLYLAGEVLNIDALTGGFNFQACWSGGWVISESL